MNRFETRLAKLEGNAPATASPFDGLTIDELSVFLLEEYAELLARADAPAELRIQAKREMARISWQIIETVNFASGRWAKPPGFDNYQERITSMKRYWERLQSERGKYVPSLNHEIESGGFGGSDPVTPGRTKCWAHPIVKQIVKDAPTKQLPAKTFMHECESFKNGRVGRPSETCGSRSHCRTECLNARREGFLTRISPKGRQVAT